ncbi:hypothetical protein COV53_03930 [Candidatus Gottesmanbacteria bacterium CG11_big_fil_rev_8_21_14_0_20_37_11]|uniref:Uncharacterized protein n=3 Tax=Candidatus Gottesmaniibacteriota TaxID=1752720 RepID=A0A2M7RPY3_9BACT|nr:MAG: hypothetical protein AUJ73_03375 [Candidatus Gottesmanbacteria bacterium CG1_02_37_22]PIR08271.1 MAG: hypothetical protein COV53_03930 [Candidatus Gottesmanbacteria bacterium CG11_big_fil_rev_8_21_14_0_20_37_11]PIZ02125.1 MAG: hypothetical protein COY59_06430 [Candidatus Gottesmanbacteria bacterium CG_4_10_14_0_8_um_filter_37_24]
MARRTVLLQPDTLVLPDRYLSSGKGGLRKTMFPRWKTDPDLQKTKEFGLLPVKRKTMSFLSERSI